MVLINDRRFVAVRGDGQKSVTILVEASDDSYALSANVRDAVSSNLNAKSDGYSKSMRKRVLIYHLSSPDSRAIIY